MSWLRSVAIYSPDEHRGWMPWGALAPVLAFVFIVASVLTGSLILEQFMTLDARGNPIGARAFVAYLLLPFSLLLALILGWVTLVERRPLASIGLAPARRLRLFVTGVGVGVASLCGIVVAIWLLRGYQSHAFAEALRSGPALVSMLMLLAGFVVQASVEEIVFRGWLLSVLAKKFNVLAGVVVSSALFGLLHFTRGQDALITISNFLFGVFACGWALRSRNILGVMGWHAGWNWLLAVGFTLPVTGVDVGLPALLVDLDPIGPDWLTGGSQGPEGSLITVVFFLSALIWMSRKR